MTNTHFIGSPGSEPRLRVTGLNDAELAANTRDGEVCFTTTDSLDGHLRISDCGTKLVVAEPELEQLRAAMTFDAKAHGNQLSAQGCDTPLGRVQTDDTSQRKIALQAAKALNAKVAGRPYNVEWRMADNSVRSLDADDFGVLADAVADHMDAIHHGTQAILATIAACQSVQDLKNIDTTSS